MPLNLPDLDDRRFADLSEEARALIPSLAPAWTDHNPADPGITLVEMLASLTEMLCYRLNRISDANLTAFLILLNGPSWKPTPGRALDEELRETVQRLRQPDRAVTAADFEALARAADARVARARCVPRRQLPAAPAVDAPGRISVVIVPVGGGDPPADLVQKVQTYLEERTLLTTRVHVARARPLAVGVRLSLYLREDALADTVRAQALAALKTFLDPLRGGPEGRGWEFGRAVYLSEIYQLLDTLPGVDYVTRTGSTTELQVSDATRLERAANGELMAVRLQSDELVQAALDPAALTLITPEPV